MKVKRNIQKKKAALCGLAMLALPLLFGFKVDGTENSQETEQTTQTETTQTAETSQTTETTQPAEATEDAIPPLKNGSTAPPEVQNQTDAEFREYLSQFQGKTIVDILFEGAGDETRPTIEAAIISRVGDAFDVDISLRDRDVIRNTGYFYEAYQTVQEVPEGVILTYHAMENPVLTDIKITGNTIYKNSQISRMITVRRGTILNSRTLHDNLAAIQEKYHGDGYIRMKLTDMNVDEEGVLNLKINEGILEGYSVKGNKKTKDYVVLREMRQKVGEPFNAKLARRSMERVYNLLKMSISR